MTAALPSISAITSAPLPFYDPAKGSFKLPPLVDDARRGSILLDTSDAMTYRVSTLSAIFAHPRQS